MSDDLPPSRRPPWWHGLADRDWILLGFITVCVIVAMIFFVLIVALHES